MRLLRLTFLTIFCLCCCIFATADVGRLFTSSRLSSMLITSIAQDNRGYIWVGTQNGLNRFDGYRFTTYMSREGDEHSISHNNITTLFIDRGGKLWVGTPKGLCYYDEANDAFVRQEMEGDPNFQPRISQIAQRRNGDLLIGTSGFGLFELKAGDALAKHCERYAKDGTDDYYPAVHIDKQGRFWKGTNNGGIFCYADNGKLLLSINTGFGMPIAILDGKDGETIVASRNGVLSFSKNLKKNYQKPCADAVSGAFCGQDKVLLLGTNHGMMRLKPGATQFEPFDIESGSIDFTTANVNVLFQDRQRNLWIGCAGRGLLFVSHRQEGFANWTFAEQCIKIGGTISSIAKAADGGIWASLSGDRLYHFSTLGLIDRSFPTPKGLNVVYRDRLGKMWVEAGTTLYSMNEPSVSFSKVKSFDCDFLESMTDDGHGTLFISTFGNGMAMYDTKTGTVRQFTMFDTKNPRGFICNNWVFAMLYDSHGLLWLATSSGVSCYNPRTDSFRTFKWHNIVEGYACLSLAEDKQGNIYIGTDRGLFRFDRNRNKVHRLAGCDELNNKTICAIACQPDGDVWCSTSMGIWHYRASDKHLIGHINDNGLREREFANGLFLRLGDGRLVFGNSVGLVAFTPGQIRASVRKPASLSLTAVVVGGATVNCSSLSGGSAVTKEPVALSRRFELAYSDNSFSMEFSNFDFGDAGNITIEYRLNGDEWSGLGRGQNSVVFNHLSPGHYKLHVRAVENGQYSDEQTYTIVIRSPWYSSMFAIFCYILFAVLLAGYILFRYRRRQSQQLAEEKMQLLINATHDIRTPLTLILSPLHQLMKRPDNDAEQKEKLSIIDHNSRRILNLVNQILDIRKIDKEQMHLQCQETDLVPFVSNIYKVFEAHANERGIKFTFSHPAELKAWVDRVQFDKVIQNLLSNAFKFTSDGGEIEIRVERKEERGMHQDTKDSKDTRKGNLSTLYSPLFTLSVRDTGTGLREADIPKLFTRFYQSVSNQAQGKDGTGIGLNLCKKIVEMHHGTITAGNRTDGVRGSVFTVTMPLGKDFLKPEEIKDTAAESGQPVAETLKPKMQSGRHPYILLVDDDAEITDYISSELSAYYHFSSCQNGKEALHELLSDDRHYDLVVSDIMMPEMDGFTLLRTIKSNPLLSHTPVILLTSESAVGNRLEGLQNGADAFLAKPFLIEELQATINNLLAKAVRMKDKFSGAEDERKEQVEQRDVTDNDKQLMDRIMQSINKNLDNSDYSVEQMADDVGLSRSQLHRKMKALTGITPSDFLRNLRLEQAARLLRERKANVSQVAYSVGFNSLGNFSKAFKQHFGMPPTEYASQGGNE